MITRERDVSDGMCPSCYKKGLILTDTEGFFRSDSLDKEKFLATGEGSFSNGRLLDRELYGSVECIYCGYKDHVQATVDWKLQVEEGLTVAGLITKLSAIQNQQAKINIGLLTDTFTSVKVDNRYLTVYCDGEKAMIVGNADVTVNPTP